MTTSQYFQEKKFRKNFRRGFYIRVEEDKRDILFTPSGKLSLLFPNYDSSATLKPEIKELLDTCQPYRMIKNASGHTDFYFMWADSLVKFKLSLDI